jgi:hypothetical protein
MTTERSRIELEFRSDPWLMQVVSTIVAHYARRAGLDEAAQGDLVAAAEQACADTFKLLPDEGDLIGMVVEDLADRVEVTLKHHGEALPSAGLETFAGLGEGESADFAGLMLISRVDRVLYETAGGTSRTILIKYTSGGAKGGS